MLTDSLNPNRQKFRYFANTIGAELMDVITGGGGTSKQVFKTNACYTVIFFILFSHARKRCIIFLPRHNSVLVFVNKI